MPLGIDFIIFFLNFCVFIFYWSEDHMDSHSQGPEQQLEHVGPYILVHMFVDPIGHRIWYTSPIKHPCITLSRNVV